MKYVNDIKVGDRVAFIQEKELTGRVSFQEYFGQMRVYYHGQYGYGRNYTSRIPMDRFRQESTVVKVDGFNVDVRFDDGVQMSKKCFEFEVLDRFDTDWDINVDDLL